MNSIAIPCSVFSSSQQFEDLRLHGDVERRRRLVGDQQFGTVGQRHGDHHALPLTARKLVRVGGKPFPGLADADLVEQVENLVPGFIGPDLLVQVQDFAKSASRPSAAD
jgi:hypothetical protein